MFHVSDSSPAGMEEEGEGTVLASFLNQPASHYVALQLLAHYLTDNIFPHAPFLNHLPHHYMSHLPRFFHQSPTTNLHIHHRTNLYYKTS